MSKLNVVTATHTPYWFRVQGLGFRVEGSGFRVYGLEFRVEGSGFRVVSREWEYTIQGIYTGYIPFFPPKSQQDTALEVGRQEHSEGGEQVVPAGSGGFPQITLGGPSIKLCDVLGATWGSTILGNLPC